MKFMVFVASVCLGVFAHSAESNLEACGAIGPVQGTTCKDLSVTFDLNGCETGVTSVPAKIDCSKENKFVATYRTEKYNYRLSLEKQNVWSQEAIVPKGKIWRAIRKKYLEANKSEVKAIPVATAIPAAPKTVNPKPEPTFASAPTPSVVPDFTPTTHAPASTANASIEKPQITMNVSGSLSLEYERTEYFGFETSGINSFTKNEKGANQDNFNLSASLGLDVGTEKDRLYALVGVGEVFFGNEATGGNAGASSTDAFQLANVYLEHQLTSKVKLQGGIAPVSSDPRAFIFSDDLASLSVIGNVESMSYQLWYGEGTKLRPNDTTTLADDRYFGLSTNMKAGRWNLSPFIVNRHLYGESFEDASANAAHSVSSSYSWAGVETVWSVSEKASLELSGIYNYGNTSYKINSGDFQEDSYSAYLADIKWSNSIGSSGFSYSLEGLMTSGAKDSTSNGAYIIGRRESFSSAADTAGILTIATNDGAGDSPGSEKESVDVAPLSLAEGLRVGVFSVMYDLSEKDQMTLRYGHLRSAEELNNSTHIGDEVDFQCVHKITDYSLVQLDFAYFMPGDFFVNNHDGYLVAAKYQINF